jgi:hypothetical protein
MTKLRFTGDPASLGLTDFLWAEHGQPSSLQTTLGPRLHQLGDVPALARDFVHLAVLAYLTDRTTPRPETAEGNRWARDLELNVPVSAADTWRGVAEELTATLGYLSGDRWTLTFRGTRVPRTDRRRTTIAKDRPVTLFSGGADSLCGALVIAADTGVVPTFVTHWDVTITAGIQQDLAGELASLWREQPAHLRPRVARAAKQLSSAPFGREPSSRSRSLLFIALGVAVAAQANGELVIPENGFASLNIPLGGERRSSLSTRTTHPAVLDGLQDILQAVGLPIRLRNPFESLTKGEMFSRVAGLHGKSTVSQLLSASHSCAKPDAFRAGYPPSTHCGLCFGCLVRRAAFIGAGVPDLTEYIEEDNRGPDRAAYVTPTRRQHYEALRYRIARGVSPADVLTMQLPDRVDEEDALDLCRRALDELALLNIP